jgi:hypothetical protein
MKGNATDKSEGGSPGGGALGAAEPPQTLAFPSLPLPIPSLQ